MRLILEDGMEGRGFIKVRKQENREAKARVEEKMR